MTDLPASTHEVVELVELIESALQRLDRPLVVGISGFGGSGKSTLARVLVGEIDVAVRLRGDDFLDPVRSHRRSADWDGVERTRIRDEVLRPFRSGRSAVFRRYDWSARTLGAPEVLEPARVLIVDSVGLFHPELDGCLDLTIWVDVELDEATRRGMARDQAAGSDHDELWRAVWVPNERDFVAAFAPRESADLRYQPETQASAPAAQLP
jgi:uridine kinase